ncbi:hypothetical protein [Arthrobacter sp. RIT-PI-e]|uniref:hypothetical protein n=1 Tax=Arthrobacter sp. RIT-PI-e TaxID=1681197 RepID=UPI0019100A9E|nr:hypothetical protein [Arthrobacter sp. RIT-PI-e]
MEMFIRSLAAAVLDVLGPDGRLVAIDGVDGSGKTTFAAALAAEIHDRPVITIHADDFLNPPTLRHARGRHSPEGFWQDTYDYRMLREYVLTPLGPKGDGWYSPVGYDPGADRPMEPVFSYAPPEALVLAEGMFHAPVRAGAAPLLRCCTALGTRNLRHRQRRRRHASDDPARHCVSRPIRHGITSSGTTEVVPGDDGSSGRT